MLLFRVVFLCSCQTVFLTWCSYMFLWIWIWPLGIYRALEGWEEVNTYNDTIHINQTTLQRNKAKTRTQAEKQNEHELGRASQGCILLHRALSSRYPTRLVRPKGYGRVLDLIRITRDVRERGRERERERHKTEIYQKQIKKKKESESGSGHWVFTGLFVWFSSI